MQRFITPSRLVTLLALTAGLLLSAGVGPARAQIGTSGMTSLPQANNPQSLGGAPVTVGPAPQVKQPQAPPAALPGAGARADRVAPSKGPVITDPNEALFDAINRGDIASARDALDRGASLDAHNILGMTPIDLSVDLARNDITFLLLSLRNGDLTLNRHGPVQAAQATAGTKPGTKPTPAGTKVAARAPAKQAARIDPAVPAAPRLFAGDGGTPNPGAGFLGFDNRH